MTASVCALGFFDGVHKAHTRILTDCVSYAKEHNLKSIAITFEKSPAEFFGKKIKYLTGLDYKKELMADIGIDEVVVLPCNEEILSLSPEEFVDSILIKKLNASALFCGFNYTFGKGAAGDIHSLKKLCSTHSIEVFVSPCMTDCGVAVSSSEIRLALSTGNIELANKLLGRPFEIHGKVKSGKQLGRAIGFPTANIYPDNHFPDMPYGVYATQAVIGQKEYIAVTNVGINPTVQDGSLRIETYITDFQEDIYGMDISLRFYKFIRKEKKFESLDELKLQIEKDKQISSKFFQKLH